MSIVLILIMAIVIYVVLENNKIEFLFEYLRSIDVELERRMIPFVIGERPVDVFTVQEIRNMIKSEFVNKKIIDEFNVYKEDMYKIHVMLRRGMAVQGLEIITNGSRMKLIETSMSYSNIEFSKK